MIEILEQFENEGSGLDFRITDANHGEGVVETYYTYLNDNRVININVRQLDHDSVILTVPVQVPVPLEIIKAFPDVVVAEYKGRNVLIMQASIDDIVDDCLKFLRVILCLDYEQSKAK